MSGLNMGLWRLPALVLAAAESEPFFTAETIASVLVTMLATAINLLVVYLVLKRFLFKPIMGMIERRQAAIDRDLDSARESQVESQKSLGEARQKVDEAVTQAAKLVRDARIQASMESQGIVKEARDRARDVLDRATEQQEHMRRALMNDVRSDITDLSIALASELIGESMGDEQQRAMLETILDQRLAADGKLPERVDADSRAQSL